MIEKDLRELTQVSLEMLAVLESLERAHDNDLFRLAEAYRQLEERAMGLIGYPRVGWIGIPQLVLTVSSHVAAREAFQDAVRVRTEMELAGTSQYSVDPEYLQVIAASYSRLAVLIDATANFVRLMRKTRDEQKEAVK